MTLMVVFLTLFVFDSMMEKHGVITSVGTKEKQE